MSDTTEASIRPCPWCRAVFTAIDGKVQGRVVFSGGILNPYVTAHTPECTAKTEDHPLPLTDWGAGRFTNRVVSRNTTGEST